MGDELQRLVAFTVQYAGITPTNSSTATNVVEYLTSSSMIGEKSKKGRGPPLISAKVSTPHNKFVERMKTATTFLDYCWDTFGDLIGSSWMKTRKKGTTAGCVGGVNTVEEIEHSPFTVSSTRMIALCRLENRAFGESVSASAVQGRQLGEVHADEMLTSINSILSDALKYWHVCECNRHERRAITESGYPNASQGWQLKDFHTREMLTLFKSTISDDFKHWQVCEVKRLERASAESVSPNAMQGWQLREVHAGEMLTFSKSKRFDAFKH